MHGQIFIHQHIVVITDRQAAASASYLPDDHRHTIRTYLGKISCNWRESAMRAAFPIYGNTSQLLTAHSLKSRLQPIKVSPDGFVAKIRQCSTSAAAQIG